MKMIIHRFHTSKAQVIPCCIWYRRSALFLVVMVGVILVYYRVTPFSGLRVPYLSLVVE